MRFGVGFIFLFDEGIGFVDKGRVMDKVDVDFCKVFSEFFVMFLWIG